MSELQYTKVLINEEYLKAYSPLPLNYKMDEIRPFITIAENIWIVDVVGKKLYSQLIEEVDNNEVTPENATLLLKIYPYLAVAVCFEALPFIAYHFDNKGITKGKSDNSDSITGSELSNLQNHMKSELEVLRGMLEDFLNENSDLYPLYTKNSCNHSSTNICDCAWAFLDNSNKKQYYKSLLKNKNTRLFSNN